MAMKKLLAMAMALMMLTPVPAMGEEPEEQGQENIPAWVIEEEVEMASAMGPDSSLPVKSAILMAESTGEVLWEMEADTQLPPASITKIMSLLLVMEAIDSGAISLTDRVTCSENAAGYGGSEIWLKAGEEMTVEELLKAAAVASANDATVCLAEYVAGSEEAFVERMNKRAQELGMTNTHFVCAAGLDHEGHLSTARDIAIMSRELLRHPLIKNYTTIWMDSLRGGATQLVNTNRLVRFYEGTTGLKTGTTDGAGSCLSATAERNGLGLIAVVMGADTSDHRFAAARALLDWGFSHYQAYELEGPAGLTPVPVTRGVEAEVPVSFDLPGAIVIPRDKGESVTQEVELAQSVEAPVTAGQQLGTVTVRLEGETVLTYPLVASQGVERMTFSRAFGALLRALLAAR